MAESENDKRDRILKTAVRLFGREGFYGTHMSEVARQARISPKTLYKFFSSKKELFMATRQAAMNRLVEEIAAVIAEQPPELDGFTVVENALKSYSDFIRKNRGLARIIAESIAVTDQDIQNGQRESFSTAVKAISLLMKGDVTEGRLKLVTGPEKTALLLLSFAAILAYSVLLDLDRKSAGGFDPGFALDLFFEVMREH
ncbi:MAG TPA: TetR/AcrR family transcriptional regulator [Candidatus Anoxymicrobiaceae bacterium]